MYILEEAVSGIAVDQDNSTTTTDGTATNQTKQPYPTSMIGPVPPMTYPMAPDPWRFHQQMGNNHISWKYHDSVEAVLNLILHEDLSLFWVEILHLMLCSH